MTRKIIAVTGATGFIGKNLVFHAINRGYTVKALTRNANIVSNNENLHYIVGDMQNYEDLNNLTEKADVIIHLAGTITSHNHNDFRLNNVIGTQNLINNICDRKNMRFIHMSSLAAREKNISDYGLSKFESEKAVISSNTQWTIIRPPAVYGRYDREILELFKWAKWRIMPSPIEGKASFLNVNDLCTFLINIIDRHDTFKRLFNFDSGLDHRINYDQLASLLSDVFGHRVIRVRLSENFMTAASFVERKLRRANSHLTMDRVRYYNHPDWIVSPDKLPPEDLLANFNTSFHSGLSDLYQWYKSENWL